MKMHGPFTVKLGVVLTDGKQFAEASYDMPAGVCPTAQEIQDAKASCLAEAKAHLGKKFRLATKQEFQNHLISERFGVDGNFAVSGSDDWEPTP